MKRPYFIVPVPVVFFLVAGVALLLGIFWPLDMPKSMGLFYAGWALVDAGMVIMLWTVWLMLWRKTTLNPYGKPQRLLSEGPFRASRNPLYVAMLVVYTGGGMVWGSYWFMILLPALVLLLQFGVIRHEERLLLLYFGDDYAKYCEKVRRWL